MAVNQDNSTPVRNSAFRRSDTLRFSEFELSPKTGELRRNGRLVKLQHQPCRVLSILATRSGELITRDELRQEIWPNGTFVDFEHGINFCIKQIRAALGDDAQSPAFIETLPRRGYRFIAQVEILNGGPADRSTRSVVEHLSAHEAQADDVVRTSVSETPAKNDTALVKPKLAGRAARSRITYAAAFLIVASLLTATYVIRRPFGRAAAPSAGRIMLAVIPFDCLSQDAGQQYFTDGLTEEMIMQLGGLQPRRLGVIARTSVMRYRQTSGDVRPMSPDIRQISKDLGVDYVLEGSVRPDGDRVAITARLIQCRDQTQLWSESYEAPRSGVFSVQKSIAAKIAGSLVIELLQPLRSDAGATGSAEAHELYLRAQYLKNKGDPPSLQRSADYFEQAIERDPDYALAYSGLADSYRILALTGAAPAIEMFPKSRAAAFRSIELADSLAEAHSAMGSVKLWFERSLPEAEVEFQRAIELNPSYGWTHHDYAWLLVAAGRFDEAVSQIKQGQALDPLSPLANSDVGWVYLFARRYDEAIDQIKRTLDLEPGFGSARACLIQAYIYKGMIKEALALGREEMARGGATPRELAAIESPEASDALANYLRWMLEKARRNSGPTQISRYRIAQVYAELGDKDHALASLGEASNSYDPMLVFLNVDPAYDNLRSDPRFAALIERGGLAYRSTP